MIGDAQDNPENTAAVRGVSPALLSIVAGVEVREAVHLAIGKAPNLAGRLMTIDLDGLNFDFFDLERMDNCPECDN